jgi:hypothetical protein
MPAFQRALVELLEKDGTTVPDRDDRAGLMAAVLASSWLRFAIGIDAGEAAPPGADDGVMRAAVEFTRDYALWMAYRECVIELQPPGVAPVRFCIDPSLPGTPPRQFPASTLAVITAWNPGSGEPRPNDRANRRANQQLAAHLDARMAERWPAVNAPGSRWHEESFCVLGIDLDEALRIGEAFQQRAIYYIDQGRPFLVARRRNRVARWEGVIRQR